METTSVVTQAFDHQQVGKNKRKKFNPKYMLTNSSSDEEGGAMTKDEDCDQMDDENQSSCDDDRQSSSTNDITGQILNESFSIANNKSNDNCSPPAPLTNAGSMVNPFLSPSKLSILQTFNLQQQQQQLFQQAAISAIAPQFSQQLNSSMNLSETEAKFREFAFKTMQELLNIYGLTLPPNEILDAMRNQQQMSKFIILRNTRPKIVPKFDRLACTSKVKFDILIFKIFSSSKSRRNFRVIVYNKGRNFESAR